MNVAGVRVRIYDEGKCIHEHETVPSDGNDLRMLTRSLRDMQSEVNHVLTALIQRRDASGSTQEMANRSISSDESDSVEEEEEEEYETSANPKKCKLST